MSTNLERITEHNNKLTQLKEAVADLPEAGSGSIETCTITLDPSLRYFKCAAFYYTDGSSELQNGMQVFSQPGGQITVLKNSLVVINYRSNAAPPDEDYARDVLTPNANFIFFDSSIALFFVTGDCFLQDQSLGTDPT